MYGHAMDASSLLWSQCRRVLITHQTTQAITFDAMENALFRKATELHGAISSTMEETKALVEAAADDDPTEIARGSGDDVHTSARVMVDCVVGYLYAMIDVRRHRIPEASHQEEIQAVPGHGPEWRLHRRLFQRFLGARAVLPIVEVWPLSLEQQVLAIEEIRVGVHETYKAQKLWKVPSPELRGRLRKTITERVVSGYREYLLEHPELKRLVSRGNSNTPADLEEMLAELFEG
uniref:Exocyst subunit Exo70 family protein n=1 Tax=Oryza glumipatula TaxID=40148 RepID=A0A0D9YFG4_9ORYZ